MTSVVAGQVLSRTLSGPVTVLVLTVDDALEPVLPHLPHGQELCTTPGALHHPPIPGSVHVFYVACQVPVS